MAPRGARRSGAGWALERVRGRAAEGGCPPPAPTVPVKVAWMATIDLAISAMLPSIASAFSFTVLMRNRQARPGDRVLLPLSAPCARLSVPFAAVGQAQGSRNVPATRNVRESDRK